MILVFILVYAFVWGYLKKFPNVRIYAKERTSFIIVVFSILVSLLVSLLTVYGIQGLPPYVYKPYDRITPKRRYDPILAGLSLPFHTELNFGTTIIETWVVYFEMFFAGTQLFWLRFDPSPMTISTTTLFYELLFVYTTLNIISAPLAIVAYMLKPRLDSRITGFKERYGNNSLYQWLFPE